MFMLWKHSKSLQYKVPNISSGDGDGIHDSQTAAFHHSCGNRDEDRYQKKIPMPRAQLEFGKRDSKPEPLRHKRHPHNIGNRVVNCSSPTQREAAITHFIANNMTLFMIFSQQKTLQSGANFVQRIRVDRS